MKEFNFIAVNPVSGRRATIEVEAISQKEAVKIAKFKAKKVFMVLIY